LTQNLYEPVFARAQVEGKTLVEYDDNQTRKWSGAPWQRLETENQQLHLK